MAKPGGMPVGNQKGLGELWSRLRFLFMAIIIYRIGTHIPVPGFDPDRLAELFNQNQGTFLGLFNMFSGGALERLSILALGVMPYISASIIMQLLSATVPSLEQLKKEGDSGRRTINRYTRYGTVLLATIQGSAMAVGFGSQGLAYEVTPVFYAVAISSLVAGAVFLMWLGEQITERGIGNGISMLIFAGIVAGMPGAAGQALESARQGDLNPLMLLFVLIIGVAVVYFVVFIERGQRRLLVQYPKRQVGNKVFGGQSSYLPIKVNVAGVIPAIFASSLLLFPNTISNFSPDSTGFLSSLGFYLSHGKPLYMIFFFGLIVFFAFFYTGIVFNPKEQADNLRNNGGFVLGYRPGEQTAEYLDHVIYRLTFVGAVYLGLIALIPEFLIARLSVPFYLGGTSLLIVVVVAMDFFSQIQTHLFTSQYEKILSKNKMYKSKWL